ncbi:unnamed protein product [Darwinula stevensoni]|uniref:Uncharacterized protein n=1 Tax=Darwinula stevensoni TaxID=69355 RepID=A0A7R9A489_9CRUS|nr:unnamed protein product [Darwinula stevensoni]CAG0883798.1 unnamed protein product [Darwinula stevensoni]
MSNGTWKQKKRNRDKELNPDLPVAGWIMRIYTDYKSEIPEQREWMCGMQCNYTHVDFCLVDRLPGLGNITALQDQGRTWRFLPGMDPLVDIFISRCLEFEDFGHSAAIPVKRIYGKNKMTASIIKDYMKTRRLQEFVRSLNERIMQIRHEQDATSVTSPKEHRNQVHGCLAESPGSQTSIPPATSCAQELLSRTADTGKRIISSERKRTHRQAMPAERHEACFYGTHQIPLRMIRQSCAAARSFSTEAKDVLKKQILLEGEDMGCQLPILVASMPGTVRFDANYIHAYSYEAVAGQHIVQARKKLLEETPTGKDTCTCAIYVGVTEAEKRMLALHNAKLQAVPYNVLDVLQKYHEMQEAATDGEIPKEYTDTLKDRKKRQVINNLLRMGPPVVKEFLMMAKRLEDADPGCVSKKLYHLRHLGNPSISSNDFLESLKVVNCAGDMKKLGNNLEDVIRKKTLRTSFSELAGIREEEMDHRYSQHVTDEALKPFMRLKNPEKEKEWKGYVELCIGGQVTQNTEELGADSEIITVLGSHLEVPEGCFDLPFRSAVFAVESLGEAEKCLLGLNDHQGRFHGDKNIPTAFMVDDIKQAAAIQESLRSHCLKTVIAIIN